MKEPFFSIISAVYNAERVVESTAASVWNQSFSDFEWIVVDGSSSDGTLKAIRPFLVDGRDTVISETDQGVYDAMNKGLRHAKGKVVQFLNAGDRFADVDVLSNVAAEFGDDVDAVYGDTVFELANGLTVFRPALDVETDRYRRIPFCHQSLFTRREMHLQYPFDLTYKIAADYASIAAMHRAGARMRYLRKTLNINTIEPDAISKAGQVLAASEDRRINRRILGESFFEASAYYLYKRMSLLGGGLVRALPSSLYNNLPESIRRRIY